nr:hypothetical protein [Tanacetum cinerariifolium]
MVPGNEFVHCPIHVNAIEDRKDLPKGNVARMEEPLSKLLKNFDREDLEVLWRFIKDRFLKTKQVDYMDSFLLHTLKTMFEHHVEDNVWKNQQGLPKVVSWKLFDSYGAHWISLILLLELCFFYDKEVELLEPGFELLGSKMVEMGQFGIIREQRIAAYKGYRGGGLGDDVWRLYDESMIVAMKCWRCFRGVYVFRLENKQQGGGNLIDGKSISSESNGLVTQPRLELAMKMWKGVMEATANMEDKDVIKENSTNGK